ncbi:hypothetical protein [Actinomadura sp. 6N118]|uniref:hypothetical protein n=1 Tax=Actinomadura sp. 6N118 TaxID=3375151 RepID=UPI0037A52922
MRPLLEALAWWGALTVGYLAVVSSVSLTEVLVGTGAAAAGAVAALAARRVLTPDTPERHGRSPVRPGALALLPVRIVEDTVRVLWSPQGVWGEIRVGRGAQGAVTLVVSASPGAYVGAVDPEHGRLVVHRTGGRTSALEKRMVGGA